MNEPVDVEQLESDVYRSRFNDGSVEVFLGLSLLWIGTAWMFLPAVSAFAGLLPAIFVAPFIKWRTGFLDRRVGYVKFGAERRQWERQMMIVILVVGIGLFVFGLGAYSLVTSGNPDTDILESIAPGLIALLLGAIVVGVAAVTSVWRFLVTAGVLIIGGVLVAAKDGNPGLPLIPAGMLATVWGAAMLAAFVRKYERAEPQ